MTLGELKKELGRLKKKADKGEINLEVLLKFENQVRSADIPKGERTHLVSEIGRLKKRIEDLGTVYEEEARKAIEKLPVDYKLKEALEYYFLVHAREIMKWSVNTLRTKKLPYVVDLINWMYVHLKKGKEPVTIQDFDKTTFLPGMYARFLAERFPNERTRYNARSHINAFFKVLNTNYPVTCPDVFLPKPEKTRTETGEEVTKGIPRKYEKLEKIFMALATPTPRVAKWKPEMYVLFARFLLQSCLRYGQALSTIRVADLYTGVIEVNDDVFDVTRKFIRIPFGKIFEREKARRKERIVKKEVPDFIYISETLYRELLDWVKKRGKSDSDFLFEEPERDVQARHDTVRKMTGIHDFSFYDFRATCASALFNILGKGDRAGLEVRRRGGWKPESKIPFESYVRLMTVNDAIKIVREYEIYISPDVAEDAKMVLQGRKPEVSPEEFEELKKLITPDVIEVLRSKEFRELIKKFGKGK